MALAVALDVLRGPSWGSRLRAAAVAGGAVLLTVELVQRTARGDVLPFTLVAAGVLLLAVVHRPRASLGLVLVLGCTIFLSPPLELTIGPVRTDLGQLTAGLLIATIGLPALARKGRAVPYRGPLLLLLLAIALGTATAFSRGTSPSFILGDAKAFLLYLAVVPFCVLYADETGKQRLERWVVRLATATSAFVVGAAAVGLPLEGRPGGGFVDRYDVISFSRVRPALLPLLFVATLLVASHVALHGWRFARLVQLSLFTCVWALSFNRSTWLCLAFSLALMLLLRPGPRRAKRTLATTLVAALVLPLLVVGARSGSLGSVAEGVVTRATSIGSATTYSPTDPSFADRASEHRDAKRVLRESPVVGVGVGSSYGARRSVYDEDLGRLRFFDRNFSHNSWLQLLLNLGLVGVLAFAALSTAVVRQVVDTVKTGLAEAGTRSVAAASALLGQAFEALINPNLLARASVLAFAVALALIARPEGAAPR